MWGWHCVLHNWQKFLRNLLDIGPFSVCVFFKKNIFSHPPFVTFFFTKSYPISLVDSFFPLRFCIISTPLRFYFHSKSVNWPYGKEITQDWYHTSGKKVLEVRFYLNYESVMYIVAPISQCLSTDHFYKNLKNILISSKTGLKIKKTPVVLNDIRDQICQ